MSRTKKLSGMKRVLFLAMLPAVIGSPATAQMHGDAPTEVPMRVKDGRLFVPVHGPDGTEYEFMLGTGTPTVLSESLGEKLGAEPGLTLGGAAVSLDNLQTLPDDRIKVAGRVVDGIVGPGTLNQFDVLIDAPGERLMMKPIGRRVEWEGMTMSPPIRARVLHGMLLSFDVELNGRETPAMLDLSMPAVMVNDRVIGDLGLEKDGVGDLRLGNTTLLDLPVRLSDHPLFQGWDPQGNGFLVVGAAAAIECAMSISWVHQELRTCVR